MTLLRDQLVETALQWEQQFAVAPSVTSTLSELDAALLLGMTEADYSLSVQHQTAVTKGYDFICQGLRYQVKANRPSGKAGSKVTWVAKARNYDWDRLIWILYDTHYQVTEAWLWEVDAYRTQFEQQKYLRPKDMRKGLALKTAHPYVLTNRLINKETSVLNQQQREEILKQFLTEPGADQWVAYTNTRLYFDRAQIERLNLKRPYLIQEIAPSEKSRKKGYHPGYVVMSKTEFESVFGHCTQTRSWEDLRCYHYSTPPKKMAPFFIPNGPTP